MDINNILTQLGITENNPGTSTGTAWFGSGSTICSSSPVDGKHIASVQTTSTEEYEKVLQTAEQAFQFWRNVPAPKRGEVVRQLGEALREKKNALEPWSLMKWAKVCRKAWERFRK